MTLLLGYCPSASFELAKVCQSPSCVGFEVLYPRLGLLNIHVGRAARADRERPSNTHCHPLAASCNGIAGEPFLIANFICNRCGNYCNGEAMLHEQSRALNGRETD